MKIFVSEFVWFTYIPQSNMSVQSVLLRICHLFCILTFLLIEMIFDTSTMIYALLCLIAVLALWLIRMEQRIKNLLKGSSGKGLEDSILHLHKGQAELKTFQRESIEYLKNIEARLKRSLQAVETVRFNPFKGTGEGGNQSFSTTLLNERGDGVIISSLSVRDRVSIFSKPIKKFTSEFEMTEEEKNVLKTAKDSLVNSPK